MTTISCDRCGKPVANNDPSTVDVLRGKRTDEEREIIVEYDLCRACEKDVLVCLQPRPGVPSVTLNV